MLKASWHKHILNLNFDARTSRGSLHSHSVYFIKLWHTESPEIVGVGEAAPLKDLSIDDRPDFEFYLNQFTSNLDFWNDEHLSAFPSIRFALETAILDLQNGGKKMIYDTAFYRGESTISINGLVWMADKATMQKQIKAKIDAGFTTIKLKIGAIDFNDELDLLKSIRNNFSASEITIRVDANGAFSSTEAIEKLKMLSEYSLHSIEQPIKQGQVQEMAALCRQSPIPIALDEELIGIYYPEDKIQLLEAIQPPYIIIKPTLVGGLKAAKEWIEIAEKRNIEWWITSALESNIGLNAIAQFTSLFPNDLPQGLGTGSLYSNNIDSPLIVENGCLRYHGEQKWT
ncbi:MAG: o-succinylbenzoate synthase [Cytophagales bacterium]